MPRGWAWLRWLAWGGSPDGLSLGWLVWVTQALTGGSPRPSVWLPCSQGPA
ncbi:hypothetical protein FHS42_001838 [Streptomyces zagrosensis]|uniref:Uncharacterized protein n=1 Tax=Streptomyces zagrosensis TaxID=1042984 RepID=A0A7W9Q770_9ACTN|nr:hypothetical protein [Streptomyces zagrosensis]